MNPTQCNGTDLCVGILMYSNRMKTVHSVDHSFSNTGG